MFDLPDIHSGCPSCHNPEGICMSLHEQTQFFHFLDECKRYWNPDHSIIFACSGWLTGSGMTREIYRKPRQLTSWNLGVCFTSVLLYLRLFRQRTGLVVEDVRSTMDESSSSDPDQSPPKKSSAAATASASSFKADVRIPKSYLKEPIRLTETKTALIAFLVTLSSSQNSQYTGNRSWQFIHKCTKSDINLPRLDIKVL